MFYVFDFVGKHTNLCIDIGVFLVGGYLGFLFGTGLAALTLSIIQHKARIVRWVAAKC